MGKTKALTEEPGHTRRSARNIEKAPKEKPHYDESNTDADVIVPHLDIPPIVENTSIENPMQISCILNYDEPSHSNELTPIRISDAIQHAMYTGLNITQKVATTTTLNEPTGVYSEAVEKKQTNRKQSEVKPQISKKTSTPKKKKVVQSQDNQRLKVQKKQSNKDSASDTLSQFNLQPLESVDSTFMDKLPSKRSRKIVNYADDMPSDDFTDDDDNNNDSQSIKLSKSNKKQTNKANNQEIQVSVPANSKPKRQKKKAEIFKEYIPLKAAQDIDPMPTQFDQDAVMNHSMAQENDLSNNNTDANSTVNKQQDELQPSLFVPEMLEDKALNDAQPVQIGTPVIQETLPTNDTEQVPKPKEPRKRVRSDKAQKGNSDTQAVNQTDNIKTDPSPLLSEDTKVNNNNKPKRQTKKAKYTHHEEPTLEESQEPMDSIVQYLLHNKASDLGSIDLKTVIPNIIKHLALEQNKKLANLLPYPDKSQATIHPDFTSPSNNHFWEAVNKWQEVLYLGGFDKSNTKEKKSNPNKEDDDKDGFKDDNYEAYWGERLIRDKDLKKKREKSAQSQRKRGQGRKR